MPTASAPLPDLSLVLTLVACALYDGGELRKFAYAAWVSPLPEGADPEALPPPPGTVLPGKPLPPLRAVVRVSAIQMQDAAGNPLVGLSASLLRRPSLTEKSASIRRSRNSALARRRSKPSARLRGMRRTIARPRRSTSGPT